MNAKGVRGLLMVLVLALGGCSAQKSLAQRLAGADRVIVTNTSDGLGITVTGEQVKKVVEAIATAKKESPVVTAAVGLSLEFYKGVEHLGTVIAAYEVFVVDHEPYRDTTGTLKAIYERYREEHPPTLRP